jgi:dephospho-CoA kinase
LEKNILAKANTDDVKESKSNLIVVDGIRRPADITFLRKLPEFLLISIECDNKIRYNRTSPSVTKNSDDQSKTFAEFVKDQETEADKLIPEVMQMASIKINNEADTNQLYNQLDKIIK